MFGISRQSEDLARPQGARPEKEQLRPLTYEEFKALVRQMGEDRATQGGLIPIPELRQVCQATIARSDFDRFLGQLQAEGLVHLLSHVDSGLLSRSTKADCLHHPSGAFLYWVRWL
jgi:hypothetical protein